MRPGQLTATALVALSGIVLASNSVSAEPARYEIDPEHFSIAFAVTHIGFNRVIGLFLTGSGGFTFDEETQELSDLAVSIDADSVFSNHEARDQHIRNPDFLHAKEYPKINFVMTGAEPTGERTGIVSGDLTIRGVSNPVDLEVTWNKSGPYPWGSNYVLGASAQAVIKRSEFGSTYALDGELVGDEVVITIELEAIRQ